MNALAKLDHHYVWHPFTQMRDWLKHEPRVIVGGKRAVLRDAHGCKYLDANSSIWTNLHGHNHPRLNAALQRQLRRIAHSSALGLANEPASLLAEQLILVGTPAVVTASSASPVTSSPSQIKKIEDAEDGVPTSGVPIKLQKVFFSDDGSTAMEAALKLAYAFTRRTGRSQKPRFLTLQNAYHGDTLGAVSLGHIDLFHQQFSGLVFKTDHVMAPYCYRCPYNRARPERADARDYRKCNWECLDTLEKKLQRAKRRGNPYSAFVFEPLIQGAAGMIAQPPGWLARATQMARDHGALLIADEVLTGFGRTGFAATDNAKPCTATQPRLFACHKESVQPDFVAVAKGLTGGYLPMAATLTTQKIFDAFLGNYAEFKAFFHGHSFTGNQLGAALALENLKLLQHPACARAALRIERTLRQELQTLWKFPAVGDIRQVGLIAGIELVKNWRTREPFDLREQAGIRICEAMAKRGVLTRPIGNIVVLMPPYCTTTDQVRTMVRTLSLAIKETSPS
jgi:adenosylmethionine-8-amino-7-oxononanoate aminotransferase